ncbi:hypothetical protein ABEF95_002707 [Exophiala dermatitidis]
MSRSISTVFVSKNLNVFALFVILDLYTPLASAQSSNSTGTGTDDGGAASGVGPGDIGSGSGSDSQSSTNAGAAGPDTGAVNLSRGATVAIAVVVSIVVVLGITLTVLYFLAKKRHWKVKEGLRRSARRVGSAVKSVTTPITPKRMHFPSQRRGQGQGFARYPLSGRPAGARHTRIGDDDLEKGTPTPIVRDLNVESENEGGSERDLSEAGRRSAKKNKVDNTENNGGSGGSSEKQKPKPKPPAVSIPSSSFELDTSGSGIPQTPMWKKVFGR